MPLGDPHGGNFTYTTEGIPNGIAAAIVPVHDIDRAIRFYNGLLRMEMLEKKADEAVMKCGASFIILKKSDVVGIDTGLVLRTDSPYDLHKRLVDEGVVFVLEPKKCQLGLLTIFRDDDGNTVRALEVQTE
jgi:extradiol dioxygenase family protein